jgi:hypothetical protein
MARTHRFYPSWRVSICWGLSAAIAVVLLAVAYSLVLPILKADALRSESPAATQTAFLLLLLFVATAGFTLMRKFPPVKVTPDGVFATRGTGFQSRLVRWGEIARVVPTSMFGVRFLVLVTSNPFPEQLRMLMHLDDVSALRDFVAAQAGMQHPLTLWLSEVQSASNKSLERTREE